MEKLIDFFWGLLVCIPLLPFNDLILKCAEKDPKKSLGIVTIMMAINAIIVLGYGYIMKPEESKIFILGLFVAILLVMFRKIKKLIGQDK